MGIRNGLFFFWIGKWENILKSASKKAHKSTHEVYNIGPNASKREEGRLNTNHPKNNQTMAP